MFESENNWLDELQEALEREKQNWGGEQAMTRHVTILNNLKIFATLVENGS